MTAAGKRRRAKAYHLRETLRLTREESIVAAEFREKAMAIIRAAIIEARTKSKMLMRLYWAIKTSSRESKVRGRIIRNDSIKALKLTVPLTGLSPSSKAIITAAAEGPKAPMVLSTRCASTLPGQTIGVRAHIIHDKRKQVAIKANN